MEINKKTLFSLIILSVIIGVFAFAQGGKDVNNILSHTIDLKKQDLKLYWKNDKGEIFKNFKTLNDWINTKGEDLVFAMNAGMYKEDFSPLGLYIEEGVILSDINTRQNGYGNFYMHPNGIFYITNNDEGVVCKTEDFKNDNIKYATQSGPLLLIDGKIHSKFINGSKNLNIRNGVGILPNGNLVFAMSKQEINFYDFASYFKSLGCKNALYLDGFISKTYLPDEKGFQTMEGNFGVIIGETAKKRIN